MKKLLVLVALLTSVSSLGYAAVTENFDSYTPAGTTISNGNGGSGWSGNWNVTNVSTTATFVSNDEGSGNLSGKYYSEDEATDWASRSFGSMSSISADGITFKLKLTGTANTVGAELISYGGISFQDSAIPIDNAGIAIGFYKGDRTSGNLALLAFTSAEGTSLLDGWATIGTEYSITINAVSFASHTYDVTVAGYTPVTGIAFQNNEVSKFDGACISGESIVGGSNTNFFVNDITINGVPEPSSIAFFGMGLMGLIGAGWRRFKRQ